MSTPAATSSAASASVGGGLLASCGGSVIKLWSLSSSTSGSPSFSLLKDGIKSVGGTSTDPLAVAWSSEGKFGSIWDDGMLRVYAPQHQEVSGDGDKLRVDVETMTWSPPQDVASAEGHFTCLAFTKSGKYVCGGTSGGTAGVWDIQSATSGPPRYSCSIVDGELRRIAFSPRQQFVIAGADGSGQIAVCDLQRSTVMPLPDPLPSGVSSVAFRPLGTADLVVGDMDGGLHVLSQDSAQGCLKTTSTFTQVHEGGVTHAAFMPASSGRAIVSVGKDASVAVVDLRSSKVAQRMQARDPLTSFAFLEPAQQVVVSSVRGQMFVFDARRPRVRSTSTTPEGGAPLLQLTAHPGASIKDLAFLPRSRLENAIKRSRRRSERILPPSTPHSTSVSRSTLTKANVNQPPKSVARRGSSRRTSRATPRRVDLKRESSKGPATVVAAGKSRSRRPHGELPPPPMYSVRKPSRQSQRPAAVRPSATPYTYTKRAGSSRGARSQNAHVDPPLFSTLADDTATMSPSISSNKDKGATEIARRSALGKSTMSTTSTPSSAGARGIDGQIGELLSEQYEELRMHLHEEVQNVQLELVRQFHLQQMYIEKVLREQSEINARLLDEISQLREENATLKMVQSTYAPPSPIHDSHGLDLPDIALFE